MATVIDLDDLRPSSTDMGELDSLLRRLVGKPFLFFRETYGEELTLHLGVAVAHTHPKLKHLRRGTYRLGTRASAWVLEPGTPPLRIFASDTIKALASNSRVKRVDLSAIETMPTIRPGSLITEATSSPSPHGLALTLSFLDGSQFVLLPTPDAPGEYDQGDEGNAGAEDDPIVLANWQIFMPGHRLLRAWPDGSWSYTDSRAKASDVITPG